MVISKVTLIMVFDGSFQPNMYGNRGEAEWGIQFIDTYRYTWGSIPKTSQLVNSYISELTGLY